MQSQDLFSSSVDKTLNVILSQQIKGTGMGYIILSSCLVLFNSKEKHYLCQAIQIHIVSRF